MLNKMQRNASGNSVQEVTIPFTIKAKKTIQLNASERHFSKLVYKRDRSCFETDICTSEKIENKGNRWMTDFSEDLAAKFISYFHYDTQKKEWLPSQSVHIEMWSCVGDEDEDLEQLTTFEFDLSQFLNIAQPVKGQPLEIQDDSVMIESEDMPIHLFIDFKLGPVNIDQLLT